LLNADQIVDECEAYSAIKTNEETTVKCTRCIPNRVLIDNKCIVARAKNCFTYADTMTCASCPDRFDLFRDAETVTSCVEKVIRGCLAYTRVEGMVACFICDNGYYLLNDFECRKSTRVISGCAFYDRVEGLCKKCADGKVLSADKTRCQDPIIYGSFYPQNCASIQYLSNPICQECNPGYYFNAEKRCTKCETGENCLYCDPFSPSKCLVCIPGSYQNDKRECIKIASVTPSSDTTSKTTNSDSSASVHELINGLIVVIFAFLNFMP